MNPVEAFVRCGISLAQDTKATLLLLTETGESAEVLRRLKPEDIKVIYVCISDEVYDFLRREEENVIKLPYRGKNVINSIEEALANALYIGLIQEKERVVAVASTPAKEACCIVHITASKDIVDTAIQELLKDLDIKPEVFMATLEIAIEIGREGREGRQIGTAFVIGDEKEIIKYGRQLILNPFEGHSRKSRKITSAEIKESIKEFAQLDGVFVIGKDGIIRAAGVYINIDITSADLPQGLGARHAAVAALTAKVNAIGITVSQSGGIVRVFKDGKVVLSIEPHRRVFTR